MGLLANLFFRAGGAAAPEATRTRRPAQWRVEIDDYGFADLEITAADLNGSGEAPGVQLEFEHEGSAGRQAIAFSAREAELVGRALHQAAQTIQPHERLRARKQKWERKVLPDEAPTQVNLQPKAETIDITPEESVILSKLIANVPGLERIAEKLDIPF
jgi:hypothetical protein